MRTKIIFLLLFSIIFLNIKSQDNDEYRKREVPRMTPVSPNAASLGIFGDIPVGYYTGVPDISIPIYEINLDGKVIPIKLSYHASGIKVSQESSSVGLGWALNAGGSIVREIRGRDDFSTSTPPRGYYYDTQFVHSNSNNDIDLNYWGIDYSQYKAYLEGYDSEPDLFNFNFGSFSGTFFFDKKNALGNSSAEAKGIVRKGNEYLDIRLSLPYKLNFTISDGDGFKYYFSPIESARTYNASTSDYNPNIAKNTFSRGSFDNEYTAWYLDSIVSPNKKKVTFSYTLETIVTPIFISEDVSYLIKGGTPSLQGVYKYYNYSYSESDQTRLTAIAFDGGNVSFNYSDRLDLESLSTQKAKKLESVTVYNNKNEIIKSATFQQSYLGNTSSPLLCRLMLDAVKIDNHTNKPSSYLFSYNRGELPAKNSPSCDYWGYYNGAIPPSGGTSFKLSPEAYLKRDFEILHYPGLNKKPNISYLQYGILKEIQYPTGGKSVFNFESHDFYNSIKDLLYRKVQLVYTGSLWLNDNNNWGTTSNKFEIKEGGMVEIDMDYWHTMPPSGYDYPYVEIILYKEGAPDFRKDYTMTASASSYPDPQRSREGSDNKKVYLELSAGKYYFVINGAWMCSQGRDPQYIRATINGIIKQETDNGQGGQGGGLRINSIINYSGDNKLTKKIFNYKTSTGTSTGTLITPPQHLSQYVLTETKVGIMPTGVFVDTYQAIYLNGYSTPYTPFSGTAQGGHVGYSYVEEKTIESGNESNNTGTVSYSFINKADNTSNLTDRMIKGFPSISYQENGTPLETCYFNKDMKLIKKKTFEYSNKQQVYKIKGLRVFRLPMVTDDMTIKYYDLVSERWPLIRTIDLDYQDNSVDPIKTVTEYGYNNINLLKNYTKTVDSKSNTIEESIKYPVDFTLSLYSEMKANHMVNMPIEVVGKVNTIEVKRLNKTYYKDLTKTKNMILLGKIETSYSGVSGLSTDVSFEQYDSKGNIQQMITFDGISSVYLWGYNYQYPIAEIKNVTYTQIVAVLGQTLIDRVASASVPSDSDMLAINALRNNTSTLKDIQIMTYTYKPLVGMLSVTDPSGITTYYDYDDFGRLKETYIYKDNVVSTANKQTIQKYDYHYQNQ